ncbi:hypothetical protein FACS1894132_00420 [Clostridia bacterium]|nr:hypothetical protein FACS1894132_00420 [Clostridia bacterium]
MILSACMMSIIICIADMVKPNDKYDKQLKILFSLMFILSILITVSKSDFSFHIEPIKPTSIDYSNNLFESEIANNIKKELIIKLREHGITVESLNLSVNISDDGKITVNDVQFSTSDDNSAEKIISANIFS